MSMISIRLALREHREAGHTIYDASYEKQVNGKTVEVMGHNGSHYIVILNGQLQLFTVEEISEGETD